MNDTTKPAAQAVASSHKVPSKYEVDTLGDELANLEMKLSKIRRKAILSAGEARRDQLELEDIEKSTATKAAEFREMVDRFTLPPKTVEIPAALAAVRERMAEVARQEPEAAKDLEALSAALDQPGEGGKVSLGKAYLVGEKGAEMIVPAAKAIELEKAAADAGVGPGDQVQTIQITGAISKEEAARLTATYLQSAGKAEGTPVPAIDDPEVLAPKYDDGRKVPDAIDDPKAALEATSGSFRERLAPQKMADVKASPIAARLPPENPTPGAKWHFPEDLGGSRLVGIYGAASGWIDPKTGVPLKAQDLTADYWEADRIKRAIDEALPKPEKKPGLFAKMTGR